MKKILKVLLVLILVGVLGTEVYLFFFKNEEKITESTNQEKKAIDTKYLVDIYSGYTINGLTIKSIYDKSGIKYDTITGLKDKKIEEKVNNQIKEKTEKMKTEVGDKKGVIASILGNYENSVSIIFCKDDDLDIKDDKCYDYNYKDSLNIDLTTGNEVTIKDIVNDDLVLRDQIVKIGYESLSKTKGILCSGGPCTNPEPDYSTVEDELLSLVNKFISGNFVFSYDESYLYMHFSNVSIKSPKICEDNEKGCKKYRLYDDVTWSINQNNTIDEYDIIVPFKNIVDNLTIYDKFKTSSSIFEKEGTKVTTKFFNEYNYISRDMIEDQNSLIDYDLKHYFDNEKIPNLAKQNLINEMKAIKTDNFNIYDVFGAIESINNSSHKYHYIKYDVRHYKLTNEKYKEYRKKIYLEKIDKIHPDGDDGTYKMYTADDNKREYGYEFLKGSMDRKAFFYYIFDENGKEVQTEDIVSHEYLKDVIPDSWLSLGNYKSKEAMINDCILLIYADYDYPNNLVIYDDYDEIVLKYKGKEVKLSSYSDDSDIENKLYR